MLPLLVNFPNFFGKIYVSRRAGGGVVFKKIFWPSGLEFLLLHLILMFVDC